MIGLKQNTVRVVEYDPDWANPARLACEAMQRACGAVLVDVPHVGSTAVPDLPAKPILDLAAAVATFGAMPELLRRLTGSGYVYRGDHGGAGGHLFVADSAPDVTRIIENGTQLLGRISFGRFWRTLLARTEAEFTAALLSNRSCAAG